MIINLIKSCKKNLYKIRLKNLKKLWVKNIKKLLIVNYNKIIILIIKNYFKRFIKIKNFNSKINLKTRSLILMN